MKVACDWPILAGRLTGQKQPACLQSCAGQPQCWLSLFVVCEPCDIALCGFFKTRSYYLPLFEVLVEVWSSNLGLANLLALGEVLCHTLGLSGS